MKKVFITKEGLKKIKDELDYLITVRRKEVAKKIKKSLEQGDLAENAEYAQAKEEQAFVEGKIAELKNKIRYATVIDKSNKSSSKIGVGSIIKVKFDDSEADYQIVGSSEADPSKGKISNESPIGKSFLGRRAGERVKVNTPKGLVEYTILEVR